MGTNVSGPVNNLPARNTVTANAAASPAANSPAANAPRTEAAEAPQTPPAKQANNQVMGFFEGFVKEGVDTLGGVYTLVTTNPITTAKGLVYMATHPSKALAAITQPYTTAYKEGNYGELAGRLSFQVLTFVVTSGALAKNEGKASQVAAEGAKGGTVAAKAAVSVAEAETLGARKAVEQLLKTPAGSKLGEQGLMNLMHGPATPMANQMRSLSARYAAEAAGVSAEVMDRAVAAVGKNLGKTNVVKYVQMATGTGLTEAQITENLARFAADKGGGKAAMSAATATLAQQAEEAAAKAAAAAAGKTVGETVGGAIDGTTGAVKGAVNNVKGAVKGLGENIKGAGRAIGDGAQAVKNVYNAEFTVGQAVHAVGAIPGYALRGVGVAYDKTIGRLLEGIANIRIVNPFHMPNMEALANIKIRPLHILAAPVTVPLGITKATLSMAFHNPVRFMGVAGVVGDIGNAAKMGELLKTNPTEAPATAAETGFHLRELKDGDTPQSIAQAEYGNAHRWRRIYEANQDFFGHLGEDGHVPDGTKLKIPDGPFSAASDYKDAVLDAIDTKAGNLDEAATTKLRGLAEQLDKMTADEVLALTPQNVMLTALAAKLDSMAADDVAALKPKLDALGLTADLAGGTTPAANTPAANTPAANAPAANTPAANAPTANKPAANTPATNAPASNAPTSYTVTRNDSLWSIAQDQLGNAEKWRDLVGANKDKYPSLETNPDFIQVGWQLKIPPKGAGAVAAAPTRPTGANPPAANAAPSANAAPAAGAQPNAARKAEIVKQYGLEDTPANWTNFWNEISAYKETAIGPDIGTDEQRKAIQTLLSKLGFPVQVTGKFDEVGADGTAKVDAHGHVVSPTADAIVAFKKMAGITQSYNTTGANGKPEPEVNEYVDIHTRETMSVTLRLLQNPGVRGKANMLAAVKEASSLAESAIGPDTGAAEGRKLVQQYLGAIGYSNVKVSGGFDQATQDALIDFKKKHNLAASYQDDQGKPVFTPYVDGPTAEALYQASTKLQTK